jgi:Protein of unknown function (DUF3891)
LRADEDAVVAIGQPSHAWVSGQLARAWGNERFGAVDPYEEVCLAAEQHDIGMAAWDLAPSLNPDTGLPYSFIQMPIPVHLELWTAGPRRLLRQSRYAALLAAMHGRRLYEHRDLSKLPPEEAGQVRRFIAGQQRFEEMQLSSLRADPATARTAAAELVARNSQLVWIWDFLSLALCLDWAPSAAREVPTNDEPVDIQLRHADRAVILEPWPFGGELVRVRCEGQRLSERFENEHEMHEALAEAPWETLEFELTQG